MALQISENSRQHIELVAQDILKRFDEISAQARAHGSYDSGAGVTPFANVNTLTSGAAIKTLTDARRATQESYQILAREPAIARVVVADEDDQKSTYYICRTTGLGGDHASYRSPVGRLASLGVGGDLTLPNGAWVEVIERSILHPLLARDGWDSTDTMIEGEQLGPFTVDSLRAVLIPVIGDEAAEDLVGQLLAEEAEKASIVEGVRRSLITKMGLRDQPILDQYQDEIFRLPIDARLLILGPAGTGKTTTLIRRLGQKLDLQILEGHEKRVIENVSASQDLSHADSWLMFTPTELLKQYLKEAFAREGVPAPDQRIQTWIDYRHDLARNAFNILRTSSGGGTFVLKSEQENLSKGALEDPINWYEDFDSWQRSRFIEELREAATALSQSAAVDFQALGARLLAEIDRSGDGPLASIFSALASQLPSVRELASSLRETSDAKIRGSLNLQLNRDKTFIDELGGLIESLNSAPLAEADDLDDADAEDDDEIAAPRAGKAATINAYTQAIRSLARAKASKRSLNKNSRAGKIIDWLGDRIPSDSDLLQIGGNLLTLGNARRFVNPVKRYVDGIPKRYRAFRRQRQDEGRWYLPASFDARNVNPLEVDVILLSILRSAADFLRRQEIMRDIDTPAWSSLQPFLGHFRNQILVDEATDFSPIQLACMGALTHPQLRSFFACGDFNQRLTAWGARTSDELQWVFPDLEIREVTVSYRQSKQLNDLARAIIKAVGGIERHVSLPTLVDNDGVPPALLEGVSTDDVVLWLAERILEIERFVGQLPSTAIFVNSEKDVGPIAEALNAALAEDNIPVMACREGQAVGQEGNVRVFDIQHIKGLEFEAVFFISIDQLAAMHPALFDKYLYVGATRAATYLGLTYESQLPARIEELRPHFSPDWSSPTSAPHSSGSL